MPPDHIADVGVLQYNETIKKIKIIAEKEELDMGQRNTCSGHEILLR